MNIKAETNSGSASEAAAADAAKASVRHTIIPVHAVTGAGSAALGSARRDFKSHSASVCGTCATAGCAVCPATRILQSLKSHLNNG